MSESVLFIDYATTVKLLSVPDAMAICEDVFRMHARNSVKWSVPPSQKLDVGAPLRITSVACAFRTHERSRR